MPYISNNARGRFNDRIDSLADSIGTEGELAYCLYRLVCDYDLRKPNTFATKNTIIGVLDNVKYEFQDKVLAPYERAKLAVNGDIYDDHTEAGDPGSKTNASDTTEPAQGPGAPGFGALRAVVRGGAR